MKNLILIVVAALFAFNVSAQTDSKVQKSSVGKVGQTEIQKKDNSTGKTEKVILYIESMNRDIESKILKVLKRIDGVIDVETNVMEKTAAVSFDVKLTNAKDILLALEKENYKAKLLTDQTANEKVTVLQVEMKVKGDEVKIEEILTAINGVKKVVVNLKQGTATVTFNAALTHPNNMIGSLEKAGFVAKVIS